MKPLKKAILPVGGMGTRFLPATKAMPKEMLCLVDRPLIHYAFEEAREAGIEQFIFVTGRNKNIITNHFDNSYELEKKLSEKDKKTELDLTSSWMPEPGSIAFIRQQQPLGLGHAVWCARNFIEEDEPFAILLADDVVLSKKPCLQQMRELHEKSGGDSVVAVEEVPKQECSKYGVIKPKGEFDVNTNSVMMEDMVEKPRPEDAPSNLAIIGRYILNGSIFKNLSEHNIGAGGEIQLTDAMAQQAKNSAYHAYKYEGTRYDCGSKIGFLEANIAFALEHDEIKQKTKEMIKKYSV